MLGLGLVMGVWNDPMTPGVRGGGERQAGLCGRNGAWHSGWSWGLRSGRSGRGWELE